MTAITRRCVLICDAEPQTVRALENSTPAFGDPPNDSPARRHHNPRPAPASQSRLRRVVGKWRVTVRYTATHEGETVAWRVLRRRRRSTSTTLGTTGGASAGG